MSAPVLADPYCLCGCRKTRHNGKGGCRDCGQFSCDKFTLDFNRQATEAPTEPMAATLRRAEQERDEARAELDRLRNLLHAERAKNGRLTAELTEAREPAAVIDRYHRYLCETCGSRYREDDTTHPHGPLTPITVTTTRWHEGS